MTIILGKISAKDVVDGRRKEKYDAAMGIDWIMGLEL